MEGCCWAFKRWADGQSSRYCFVWLTVGRAGGRASGRSAGRSAGTFLYTISVFSSTFVIMPRIDSLKWKGELKCFLIPREFTNVGNTKVYGSAKHYYRALRLIQNHTDKQTQK